MADYGRLRPRGFAAEEDADRIEGLGGVVDAYFELCARYHVKPVPAVTIALRYEGVTYLQLEAEFGAADLLPLAELLQVSFSPPSMHYC